MKICGCVGEWFEGEPCEELIKHKMCCKDPSSCKFVYETEG